MLAGPRTDPKDVDVLGGTETSVQSQWSLEALCLIDNSVGFDLVIVLLVANSKQDEIGRSAGTHDSEVVRPDLRVVIYLQLQ